MSYNCLCTFAIYASCILECGIIIIMNSKRDHKNKFWKEYPRNKSTQGYHYDSGSFNVKDGYSNSQSYSERVGHGLNSRSRFPTNRSNPGYLKYFSSHCSRKDRGQAIISTLSVTKEKEFSDESMSRRIQKTSEMIRKILKSQDHSVSSTKETAEENQKSQKELVEVGEGSSNIFDDKIIPSVSKPKKKSSRQSELENKKRRKFDLRENMKNANSTDTSCAYNVKELSDQILKHISSMNSHNLTKFLNTDNPHYQVVLKQECRQKRIELSKALRDLSHQERPEECDVVNSIIPDFLVKIEDLPKEVIRELSSTFDDIQNNVGDSDSQGDYQSLLYDCSSSHNISSVCDNLMESHNISTGVKNKSLELIENLESTIEVLDSDEENSILKQKVDEGYSVENVNEEKRQDTEIKSCTDSSEPVLISSQVAGLDVVNKETIPSDELLKSPEATAHSIPCNQESLTIVEPLETSSVISILHTEMPKNILQNDVSSTFPSSVEIKKEMSSPMDATNIIDFNSQPKVGSVWVSRNIFEASSSECHKTQSSNVEKLDKNLNHENIQEQLPQPTASVENVEIPVSSASNKNEINSKENPAQIISDTHDNETKALHSNDSTKNSINVPVRPKRKKTENVVADHLKKNIQPNKNRDLEKMINQVSSSEPVDRSSTRKISLSSENRSPEIISLTINEFEKPKFIADAVELMRQIDGKIEILNQLRQDIFIGLSKRESICGKETQESIGQEPDISDDNTEEPAETPLSSLDSSKEVIRFCQVLPEKEECIVGTDDGKIHYHSILRRRIVKTIDISISDSCFMHCLKIFSTYYICIGSITKMNLIFYEYKSDSIEREVYLEDPVEVLRHEWGNIFIGGKRGYLTIYDWKKKMIKYENREYEFRIRDLRTTREGARRILIVLYEDNDGVGHIHVRDAMTFLYIRTIVETRNVRCIHLKYFSVYVVLDGEIRVYNYQDGSLINCININQKFNSLAHKGKLLLLATAESLHGLSIKNHRHMGPLREGISILSMDFVDRKVVCFTSENKIEVLDLPQSFKTLLCG